MKKETFLGLLLGAVGITVLASSVRAREEKRCADYPLDKECVCPVGQWKQMRWVGWDEEKQKNIYEFYCVPARYEWTPIDPTDPNIEEKLLDAVRYIMANIFPDVVPDFSCQPRPETGYPTPEKPKSFMAAVGIEVASGRYTANVECIEVTEWDEQGRPKTGMGWFRFEFYLDDGGLRAITRNFYINPERTHYWMCHENECWEGDM